MEDAIETATVWLGTASAAMKGRFYTTALYSMEMTVEIALKAVLIEFGVNVPKLHNVTDVLRMTLDERRSALPKEFREQQEMILSTYNDLLEIRPQVGYTFEAGAVVNPKAKAEAYLPKAKKVVELCGLALKHIRSKK